MTWRNIFLMIFVKNVDRSRVHGLTCIFGLLHKVFNYFLGEMINTLISHNSPTTISFLPPTDFQPKQKQNKTKQKK
jgi:hypothetical protein